MVMYCLFIVLFIFLSILLKIMYLDKLHKLYYAFYIQIVIVSGKFLIRIGLK